MFHAVQTACRTPALLQMHGRLHALLASLSWTRQACEQ